jgi:hypothetical protein
MIVSWFSAGVSSAVATKLIVNDIDHVFYIHVEDQHPDTMRFVKDIEHWLGKQIEIMQSPYGSVENACRAASYLNGVAGAACTRLLKRRVREEWEMEITEPLTYIWGFDAQEQDRADSIVDRYPAQSHRFPLIEKGISKTEAHEILKASGIKRPMMYELGYNNNNCIGCLKGGMGYFNHIRKDFGDVFEKRAKLERLIGASCINGTFLDELDPSIGRHTKPIVDDCGILCEVIAI